MNLLISQEWLRKKIKTEPDLDVDAGMSLETVHSIAVFLPKNSPTTQPVNEQRYLQIKHAFGLMIRQLRLRDGVSIEVLADKASISSKELEMIEQNPNVQASPRTVIQLASVFNIDKSKMMKLSGVIHHVDEPLENAAIKFAAKSEGVSSLNEEEQQLLSSFVMLLNQGD